MNNKSGENLTNAAQPLYYVLVIYSQTNLPALRSRVRITEKYNQVLFKTLCQHCRKSTKSRVSSPTQTEIGHCNQKTRTDGEPLPQSHTSCETSSDQQDYSLSAYQEVRPSSQTTHRTHNPSRPRRPI